MQEDKRWVNVKTLADLQNTHLVFQQKDKERRRDNRNGPIPSSVIVEPLAKLGWIDCLVFIKS